jgi:steroid delta-isomerase-like uncharacterized protein
MRRRLLLLSVLGFSLLAPAVAWAQDAASVVKDYLAAWNAYDIDKAASYFADDVVYYDASVGTPVEGKADATAKVVASFINAVPDLKWEMLGDPIVEGEMVAFQWRFSGTNTGAWGDGTEPANKPFMFVGASVFRVANGKIASQSDYYDALGFYKQLGWI